MNDGWMKKELVDKAYSCCIKSECNKCPYNHIVDKNDPKYVKQSFKQIYCDMIKEMVKT